MLGLDAGRVSDQAQGGGGPMDGRLQELLLQVQAGLGAAVRKGGGTAEKGHHEVPDPNQAPLQVSTHPTAAQYPPAKTLKLFE